MAVRPRWPCLVAESAAQFRPKATHCGACASLRACGQDGRAAKMAVPGQIVPGQDGRVANLLVRGQWDRLAANLAETFSMFVDVLAARVSGKNALKHRVVDRVLASWPAKQAVGQ